MVDISCWMDGFLQALDGTFPGRARFVGLQGSYSRGEATESSDIDIVVILDVLSASDLQTYRRMLDTLPDREKICGFLAGEQELLGWDPADLFQFYHDTMPVRGSLDGILPLLNHEAVDRAIKMGACSIHHGCVHNMLHGRREDTLKGLYKAASFVVQAICYRQTGRFIRRQEELQAVAEPREQAIIQTFLRLKAGGAVDFDAMSETLLSWAQHSISHR